jgi:2-keto-4-pentenoate hydratase/2-oxohepta-3-ene-1,7-dioic acid hydratase in catechol pathway
MRFASYDGRLALLIDDGVVDVADASGGRFAADPQAVYERWDEFAEWARSVTGPVTPLDEAKLGLVVPFPRQVFAIGLNYAAHAAEVGQPKPEFPPTFTKFPTCLAGPDSVVELPSGSVDWEVELVVIVGRLAHHVAEEDGWSYVAGLTVGQDLSERVVQSRPPMPQFCLGKSFPGFGPIGPWAVTPDEVPDRDDLAIECSVNGETVQRSRTNDLIFGVPGLISELSSVLPLLPGDLIFTGTPSGVGVARRPQRFLADGDEVASTIEGIGTLRVTMVAAGTAQVGATSGSESALRN